MPQSLLVFAVSFTPETTNFGLFHGVVHHLKEFLIKKKNCLLTVYMHTFEIKVNKKNDIKKNRF